MKGVAYPQCLTHSTLSSHRGVPKAWERTQSISQQETIFMFCFLTNTSPHGQANSRNKRRVPPGDSCVLLSDRGGPAFPCEETVLSVSAHMRTSMLPHLFNTGRECGPGTNNYSLHRSVSEGSTEIKMGRGTHLTSF